MRGCGWAARPPASKQVSRLAPHWPRATHHSQAPRPPTITRRTEPRRQNLAPEPKPPAYPPTDPPTHPLTHTPDHPAKDTRPCKPPTTTTHPQKPAQLPIHSRINHPRCARPARRARLPAASHPPQPTQRNPPAQPPQQLPHLYTHRHTHPPARARAHARRHPPSHLTAYPHTHQPNAAPSIHHKPPTTAHAPHSPPTTPRPQRSRSRNHHRSASHPTTRAPQPTHNRNHNPPTHEKLPTHRAKNPARSGKQFVHDVCDYSNALDKRFKAPFNSKSKGSNSTGLFRHKKLQHVEM